MTDYGFADMTIEELVKDLLDAGYGTQLQSAAIAAICERVERLTKERDELLGILRELPEKNRVSNDASRAMGAAEERARIVAYLFGAVTSESAVFSLAQRIELGEHAKDGAR